MFSLVFLFFLHLNNYQHFSAIIFFPFFSLVLSTISVQIFAPVLSQFHLSHQDDSDDETPTAKRAHGHSEGLEFMDLSCEEGEETASSDGHTEVSQSRLCCDCDVTFTSTCSFYYLFTYVIFGGEILSTVLWFLICSGQWIGRQWTGFVQWWGRVE